MHSPPVTGWPPAGLPFAVTKIRPPRLRGQRIDRPALHRALAQALGGRRVVLLQAPAGFGKTAALAGALAAGGLAAAWVSLDADDDAARVFACLVAALEPFDLPWRVAPEALQGQLADAGEAAAVLATAPLINALADADVAHGVIVFDDLHRVPQTAVHRLLEALIERLPPNWTVALGTRVDPPLPLGRWRAAGDAADFGADALRFDAGEAAALAAAEGVHAPDAVTAWHARTQGWPAGLRLGFAAGRARTEHAAGGAGDAVAQRHLFDYLASEVLADMPPVLLQFLLACSVLPELTAERAAAVSGDAQAARHLQAIERRGLFVSTLDGPVPTWVLHDLFRDVLQQRLRQRDPERLPVLLRRAAAGEPDPVRRVGYLLRAGDAADALAVLAAHAGELMLHGGAAEVQHLAEQFPPAFAAAAAPLLRIRGVVACLRWQWAEMARLMQAAAQAARGAGDTAEAELAEAYLASADYPLGRNAEAERLLAVLHERPLAPPARMVVLLGQCTQHFRRGELDRLPAVYGELVQRLEAGGSLFDWWQCAPAMNWSSLRGMRPWLERYFVGALARIGEQALPMRAQVYAQQAFSHLWAGRIDAARAALQQAEGDARWLACSADMLVTVQVLGAILAALQGRADDVQRQLQALFVREDRASDERRRVWQHQVAVHAIRLLDVLGPDAAGIRRWAAFHDDRPLDSAHRNPRAELVRARHAAASNRWADAAAHYAAVLPHAAQIDVHAQGVEVQLRAGHALWLAGEPARAAAAVAPALQRLRDDGDRGQALMCGPQVLQALAGFAWGERLDAALQQELHAAAALSLSLRAQAAPAPAPPGADDPAGLSAREREVLTHIAAGDSNKLIARVLDISPHTVKRHVANILDKLALGSRGQAAAWWREHGAPGGGVPPPPAERVARAALGRARPGAAPLS